MKYPDPTSLQHTGKEHRVGQGLVGAIETSVTYQSGDVSDPPVYSRLGNTSNHKELESVLALLEGSDAAIATGSGMSAFNLLFQALLRPGDHIVVQDCCYGGTHHYIDNILRPWGVSATFATIRDWPGAMRAETKMAVFESISNPFCEPQDVLAAVAACRAANVISVCDNTFASPVLCRPLQYGTDLVVESATKYLNGHSDVIAGLVAGRTDLMAALRKIHPYLGSFLPPQQCAQLLRGLKTLSLRVRQHTENGAAFAHFMRDARDVVSHVHYGAESAGIQSCFQNGFGGMVTVRFKDCVDVPSLMRKMKLVSDVPSLGGTESTATMPYFTTNWFMDDAAKKRLGIDTQVVRFSIGLEAPGDIAHDVLSAARSTTRTPK